MSHLYTPGVEDQFPFRQSDQKDKSRQMSNAPAVICLIHTLRQEGFMTKYSSKQQRCGRAAARRVGSFVIKFNQLLWANVSAKYSFHPI